MNELKKHLLNFYPLRTQIDPENPEEDPKDMKFIASIHHYAAPALRFIFAKIGLFIHISATL